MKRQLWTWLVLLTLASAFGTWRMNCQDGCDFSTVAIGWPVFFSTPYHPEANDAPLFIFGPLLVNILWIVIASFVFWQIIDTLRRWSNRQPKPPGWQ